jgi:hypothetical protein
MAASYDNRIFINNFSISEDGTTIDVNVETDVGYTILDVNFYTDVTFGDSTQAVNLYYKLTRTSNREIFSITAAEAGVPSFLDGIFFAEFSTTSPSTTNCDTCTNPLGVASQFLSAKLCLMEKVLALDLALDCNHNNCVDKCDVIVLDKFIKAMQYALEFGVYDEAIDLLNGIRKLCTTCVECLNLDNYSTSAGLGFYTLNNNLTLA